MKTNDATERETGLDALSLDTVRASRKGEYAGMDLRATARKAEELLTDPLIKQVFGELIVEMQDQIANLPVGQSELVLELHAELRGLMAAHSRLRGWRNRGVLAEAERQKRKNKN